jgi:agmatinase
MTQTPFDPNAMASAGSGIFGLLDSAESAALHIVPVPWEVTTSYGRGASRGPALVLQASRQVDLFDLEFGNRWRDGIFLHPTDTGWLEKNDRLKLKAVERIELLQTHGSESPQTLAILGEINSASSELNRWLESKVTQLLKDGRLPAVLGGDHSSPFGAIAALARGRPGEIGILHIDAHADLRDAYQGHQDSHASIMHNVCERLPIGKLVQVGIRDFCEEEFNYIKARPQLISTHFDQTLQRQLANGQGWGALCDRIVDGLPDLVYISFDIDGLDPTLCPNTGTPVPGGLSFAQMSVLLSTVVNSGREIVGFDLNEVADPGALPPPLGEGAAIGSLGEWDGNVGARALFRLSLAALETRARRRAAEANSVAKGNSRAKSGADAGAGPQRGSP